MGERSWEDRHRRFSKRAGRCIDSLGRYFVYDLGKKDRKDDLNFDWQYRITNFEMLSRDS